MMIRLDRDKCEGHGRCYSLAPELFESDDEGYGVVRGESTGSPASAAAEVPAQLARSAALAVANCPEYAIEIID